MSKTILHLCADVGSDTKPYRERGYNVICIGSDIGVENYHPPENVYGIIANPGIMVRIIEILLVVFLVSGCASTPNYKCRCERYCWGQYCQSHDMFCDCQPVYYNSKP